MAGSDQAMPGASSRLGQMVQLVVKALLARSPAYVWRVLRVAFSPSLILRKLALVSLLQLLAFHLSCSILLLLSVLCRCDLHPSDAHRRMLRGERTCGLVATRSCARLRGVRGARGCSPRSRHQPRSRLHPGHRPGCAPT